MRQRRLKDLDERMERFADYIDTDGKQNKGKWKSLFPACVLSDDQKVTLKDLEQSDSLDVDSNTGKELCLEIGCGKGKFICSLAEAHPHWNLIGIEGQESVIVRAAEKVKDSELENIYLVSSYVRDLRDYFEEGELDRIFLNFSDPWPKAKHAKRRLTYRENLKAYMDVLKEGGTIEFKTDNEGLFDFTLEEIEELGYNIEEMTRDLHESDYESKNYTTEYEEKFKAKGVNIKYVRLRKRV